MKYLMLIPAAMLLLTACDSKPAAKKNVTTESNQTVPSNEKNEVESNSEEDNDSESDDSAEEEDQTEKAAAVETAPLQVPADHLLPENPASEEVAKPAEAVMIKEAFAIVKPTEGNSVTGKVTFSQEGDDLYIIADFEGLKPGEHGFHIHEKGDCSAHDGSSAGGHFNPTNKPHGGPHDKERHAGDLGNVVADETGKAHYEFTDSVLKLNGPNSIIDRSVVVHADPDDLKTQPTGNSGARIGCGVIEAVK